MLLLLPVSIMRLDRCKAIGEGPMKGTIIGKYKIVSQALYHVSFQLAWLTKLPASCPLLLSYFGETRANTGLILPRTWYVLGNVSH